MNVEYISAASKNEINGAIAFFGNGVIGAKKSINSSKITDFANLLSNMLSKGSIKTDPDFNTISMKSSANSSNDYFSKENLFKAKDSKRFDIANNKFAEKNINKRNSFSEKNYDHQKTEKISCAKSAEKSEAETAKNNVKNSDETEVSINKETKEATISSKETEVSKLSDSQKAEETLSLEETEKNAEINSVLESEDGESSEKNCVDDVILDFLSNLTEEQKAELREDPDQLDIKLAQMIENLPESEEKTKLSEAVKALENNESTQQVLSKLKTLLSSASEKSNKSIEITEKEEGGDKLAAESSEEVAAFEASDGTKGKSAKKKAEKTDVPADEKKSFSQLFDGISDKKQALTKDQMSQEQKVQEGTQVSGEEMILSEEASPELKQAAEQLVAKIFGEPHKESKPTVQDKFSEMTATYGSDGKSKVSSKSNMGSQRQGSMSGGSYSSFASGNENGKTIVGKSQSYTSAAQVRFEEMLEQARLVKTREGAKILNLKVGNNGMGEMEMELKSKNGIVTAKLSVENDDAKSKIENLSKTIIEELNEQGINIARVDVNVSSNQSGQNSNYESSSDETYGKTNKSSFFDKLDNTENEISNKNVLIDLRRAALNIKYIDEIV